MNRRFLAVAGAILAALGLAGCSDHPQRQAGNNLRQKTADAHRGIQKALDLMGYPAFQDTSGRAFPSFSVTGDPNTPIQPEPNAIVLLPPDAPDPRALDFLDAGGLDQALRDNPDADAAEKAMALEQAARIHELRGRIFSWQAAEARRHVRGLLAEARALSDILRGHADSLKYFQSLLAGSAPDANALTASARQQADEKAAKLRELDAQIQALQEKAKGLREGYDRLTKEAGDLRMEGKASTGRKALDLADQAAEKQKQANAAASDLSAAENTIAFRQGDRGALVADANHAQTMLAIGTAALKEAQVLDANVRQITDGIGAAIAETQKKLDEQVGRIAQQAQVAREAEEKAAGALVEAARRFDGAQVQASAAAGVNTAAKGAEVRLALAEVLRSGLGLRAELEAFAAGAKELWPRLARPNEVPESYAKLAADYLKDANQAKETAVKACTEALDKYRMLPEKVDQNVRWIYQALVGTSWLCLYDVTQDRKCLTEASGALAEALKDKEDSPYLANVVEIHRQVQRLLQSAPAAPAP